jgi:hypothetical protein
MIYILFKRRSQAIFAGIALFVVAAILIYVFYHNFKIEKYAKQNRNRDVELIGLRVEDVDNLLGSPDEIIERKNTSLHLMFVPGGYDVIHAYYSINIYVYFRNNIVVAKTKVVSYGE